LTRRTFVLTSAALAADAQTPKTPWHKRVVRWGQTNITERDPVRYDIPWWRAYWKRTEIQGTIINAGGIVAYYPSKFPLHHRAEFLNGRDLYGDVAKAAHDDGLAVLARMDSNRTAEDFYRAHPDWFARNAAGDPIRAADKFVTCINSPYYDEYLPSVITEIIERSHPEGVTDNSWAGLGRDTICYCDNCKRKFGQPLPTRADWDDPVYRRWIEWNYARRIAVWELNNRTTKAAGGPDCLWVGMNSGSITSQAGSFRDFAEICKRADFMLLDHQSRNDATGFQQNGDTGKLVHGLLGWDKLMPESMAMYQAGRSSFRVAAKPAAEARMWMIEGIAGGIQPWWHHVGAYQEDRRQFATAEPIMRWHKAHEQYLVNRQPIAAVGVVWSQRNTDFYGRNEAAELVDAPYRGFTQALIRARIPYIPVFADQIDRDASGLSVLALPAVGAMSDAQCAAVRRFVEKGGGLIATGPASLYTDHGDARPDFALADLFGAHTTRPRRPSAQTAHTYLRISSRHEVLKGFDDTDILPFGGQLDAMRVDPGAAVPLTYIPPFPIYPPETAWMRTEKTDIPGLVLKGRVAYLPADIDRRYARENLPDHADLLANLVRWAAGGRIPLEVHGAGLVDCHLYRQPGRVILHLVNLISAGTWRGPIDELIPIGPLQVRVKLPSDLKPRSAQLLVSGARTPIAVKDGWAAFDVKSVLDHEVAVL
jgi:hypothetical protein